MILYSPIISERLRYIVQFAAKFLGDTAIEITDQPSVFSSHAGLKINYSTSKITDNELHIVPHALLSETNIHPQQITCFEIEQTKAFFKTTGDFSFDIFAATFYLISRYEEYLPHQKDMYGRYAHENSLAYREGFLDEPVVNQWWMMFAKKLQQQFPSFSLQQSAFQFSPTYDIDEAWSYKHKNKTRVIGASVKSLLRGDWSGFRERQKVLANKLQDPFDSYSWLNELHQRYQLQPHYFFLVAKQNAQYDRNILPDQPAFRELVADIAAKYPIGLHPSWQSGDEVALLPEELDRLQDLSGKKINTSRQHFIRFNLPNTYRELIKAGITSDFSMGYGSINGFRASVASPFYWYDLEKEEITALRLYPFCFMEANSFYEQHYSPQQASEELNAYYQKVKKINGVLVTIWHNTFLGTAKKFKGWREVYQQFIREKIAAEK